MKDFKSALKNKTAIIAMAKPVRVVVGHIKLLPLGVRELQEVVGGDRPIPVGIMVAVVNFKAEESAHLAKAPAMGKDRRHLIFVDVLHDTGGGQNLKRPLFREQGKQIARGPIVDAIKSGKVAGQILPHECGRPADKKRVLDILKLADDVVDELAARIGVEINGQLFTSSQTKSQKVAE